MAKPMNVEKWGKKTASERYESQYKDDASATSTGGAKVNVGLIDQPQLDEMSREMQAPQSINDHHGHSYDNQPDGWVRGMGKNAPYPHFDKGPSGQKFGKGK